MQCIKCEASMLKAATSKVVVPLIDNPRKGNLKANTRIPESVTTLVTADSAGRATRILDEGEGDLLASCIPELCLRIGTVSSITGLSVPTIYREIAHKRFPRPIKITAGARAWRLSEIMNWIETRERDQGPASQSSPAEDAHRGA
jgi:predicted DNA-binding transcriptional regulator AlpA